MSVTELEPRTTDLPADDDPPIIHRYRVPSDRLPPGVRPGDRALCGHVKTPDSPTFPYPQYTPPPGYPVCVVCAELGGDRSS